jgi:phosphatidylglycerophosphate synthase
MDIWFNSLFSLRISSLLVKTPLTPNQLTLFGLIIGLVAGLLFARGDYWSGLMGGFLLAATAVWDCCDGDVARLKFMESDFGEQLDTICDNIINVFIFTGMMIGMAHSQGLAQAIVPFLLLALGGGLIFIFIYFPEGGKGSFFRGTWLYEVIQVLASRNFIYIVVLFAIAGKLDWFLWLAGLGSNVFALSLYLAKRKIIYSTPNGGRD